MKKLILVTLLPLTVFAMDKSICGMDERVPSSDPKVGRSLENKRDKAGCTVTLISNSCVISVGHCAATLNYLEFNTPTSTRRGIRHPGPKDIYRADRTTLKYKSNGQGDDWAVVKALPNEHTGLLPGQAQGYYPIAKEVPPIGTMLSITGYGSDRGEYERHFAQQNNFGPLKTVGGSIWNGGHRPALLEHRVDTMGGNSGSSIINLETGEIIGVHSHGGCYTSDDSKNAGTVLQLHPEFKAAVESCLASE
ncbi:MULTISPECIES: trypsin-like serine peptidase [Halobacteriovorax]|uniref:Trypsin-like serine protease n=1 Tax=Halobacteriovorax vibrionivorans TaxID=2152716 RepID=A0ABY0IF70_9BACT|nr:MULTISPECIES: trypsin-like serine protease [Halobacteriovorax]AYF44647.1 trypsin [Halobacteriovorax sp. BALOs_7]RZF20733.1 trypsin-like serine protease [Halobacteriovorax vibrionivorans]TGD48122.1 trypsin-like serine protease [Halobacteriovorax sp. Y22]